MKNVKHQTLISFSIGNLTFAFGQSSLYKVQPSVALTNVPFAPSFLSGLINIEGEIIPQINLADLLKIPLEPSKKQKTLLIIGQSPHSFAIAVDQLMQDYEIALEYCLPIDSDKHNPHLYYGMFRQPEVFYWLDEKAIINQLELTSDSSHIAITETFTPVNKIEVVPKVDVLLVKLGEEQKAFKVPCIKEVVDIDHWVPSPLGPDFFLGLCHVQDRAIPLVTFSDHPNLNQLNNQTALHIIIMEKRGRVLGLVVDEILGLKKIELPSIVEHADTGKQGFLENTYFTEIILFEQLFNSHQWQSIDAFLPEFVIQQKYNEPVEELLLLTWCDHYLAIPLRYVKRILPKQRIQPLLQDHPLVEGVFDFEGKAIPVFNSQKLFASEVNHNDEMLVVEYQNDFFILKQLKTDKIISLPQSKIQYIADSQVNRFIGYSRWNEQLLKITDCRFIKTLLEDCVA